MSRDAAFWLGLSCNRSSAMNAAARRIQVEVISFNPVFLQEVLSNASPQPAFFLLLVFPWWSWMRISATSTTTPTCS
eukprot:CAMPEP_0185753718 /NCGR_PEP_ID=MMETSP1174-20130828/12438_1 /TAXON_ID=35687 /ORGANISM="Dictyocha speculum, Strain CCMP1381" /LENGTH=76 /DNA_ID=CAMNT_0028431693 /DNA_START=725 /DNA_END=951 /DNA_ORIENTATION=-